MSIAIEDEVYSRLDYAFAQFLSQRSSLENLDKKRFETLIAFLSQQQHQGHTCIEISDADKKLLLDSGFSCEIPANSPQSFPLIIEENRLYLQRYWAYEYRLAKEIKQLAQITLDAPNLDSLLDRYFLVTGTQTDWQREATKIACQQAFTIITGGPGTGKTTTVCKTLAVLQELTDKPLLIALSAPTGKAAMRLQEAVAQNLAVLNCPERIKQHLPHTAITLHRLLGANPLSPSFKHNSACPLVFDLVVVDEASMVDLALMSKLVDALKPGARLILLGDKDQLSSVESGAVLADLIAGLPNNTVELMKSYRFDDGIKQFANAVNRQDQEGAWRILTGNDETIELLEQNQLMPYILQRREEYVRLVKSEADFADIYRAFSQFQVLCANRHGLNGALSISARIEHELFGDFRQFAVTPWYPGRPVIVTQNNPALHLFNGDIGICLPDLEYNGNLMVFFLRPDGTVKKHLPARMPICESAFAMTIHKSQGSEFDEALIVLPETSNPVLSKELLYTAITRTRRYIKISADKLVFNIALNSKVERVSGLVKKLI
jgi:exodeoxyribonuclease V alpha subunit